MKDFNQRLQHAAATKKISQVDLARMLEMDKASINRWWTGKAIPRPKSIMSIAEALDCDYEWLATGKGSPWPDKEKKSHTSALQPTDTENDNHNFNLGDMLAMAKAVLRSETVYKPALAANIRALYKAVEMEEEMSDIRGEMKAMSERLERMEEMLLQFGGTLPEKKSTGTDH